MFAVTTVLLQALTFLLVAVVSVTLMRGVTAHAQVKRRLSNQPANLPGSTVLKGEQLRNPLLQWIQAATSLSDLTDRNRLRARLSSAGLDSPAAPAVYILVRFGLAIGLPLALLLEQALVGRMLNGVSLIAASLLLCGLGLITPNLIVDNRVNARRAELEHEFPDALDLLVVCVEAGLSLEAAFVRVGQEVTESHPRIGDEFGRLARELSAGRSRADALRAMADRAGVDTIRSFVALLIQTESLGVSIANTLRTYSDEMRETRFMKAEEKAMRIPVLMTLPLVGCILPVIIIVLLLPAAIDVIRTVGPSLAGHH
jgi:tight adherence protein C